MTEVTRRETEAESPGFEPSAPVGTANGALLVRDRTVDHRPAGEHIKKPSLGFLRNLREPPVPVAQEQPQFVAQLREVTEPGLQFGKSLGNQRADVPTRGSATVALRQDSRQVVQREANGQGPSHQSHAPDRLARIETIAAVAARWNREHPSALIVAQGIRADSRQPRELRGAEQRAAAESDRHRARSCAG